MTLGKYAAIVGFAVVSFFGVGVPLLPLTPTTNNRRSRRTTTGAPSSARGEPSSLRGTVRLAPPLGSLHGLFTFNDGGTMAEYGIAPGQSPALRSPGHGAWQREHGWQDFSFAFTFYRYDASGVFLGSQRVRAAATLGAGGDQLATSSIIEVLDVNDVVVGGGCGTAVGTRFE